MRRRSSGSPFEDEAQGSVSVVQTPPDQSDGANTCDTSPSSRLQVAKDYDRRRESESSDRSRNQDSKTNCSTQVPAPNGNGSSTMIPLHSQRLAVDGSQKLHKLRWSHVRNPWTCTLSTLATTALALLVLLSIIHSYATRQVDTTGCTVPMMNPAFIKLLGFDNEHTRFASKYGLYLYREGGVDEYNEENIGLKGAPVLFLPGNAGSYKQVRSLASEASRHYHDVLRHDHDRLGSGTRNLDFFMVDFNEDMAAFHGQSLLDQAEYVNEALSFILSLYHDPQHSKRDTTLPDPSSVILVGHSMGGIVARTVLTMSNYQANSVNTIITMSTPHARAPVSFDSDLVHTYKQINDYWREAYSQKWANNNPLWHVTLISIAGGGQDTIVPSDYTSLSSLVPDTHGFTVFTSGIPNVWTGMDHLSITWCNQFRKTIVQSLFDAMDVRRSSQTRPRAERMRVFKKWYLTGMEDTAEKTLQQKEPTTLLKLSSDRNSILPQGERLLLRGFGDRGEPQAHLLPIPPQETAGKRFTLLSDQNFDRSKGQNKLEVLFCTVFPLQSGQSTLLSVNMDLSSDDAGSIRLACKNAPEDTITLPASTSSSKFPFDQTPPFSYLEYDLEYLAEHQFVAVIDKSESPSPGWLIAEFSDTSESTISTQMGLGRLIGGGLDIKLPEARPTLMSINVPAMYSSLLAYKLRVENQGCGTKSELFAPLLRQSMSEPHESKFFVNMKEADINLHGIAPFVPPPMREKTTSNGVSFHLWSDPSCNTPLDFSLRVDFLGSLGKLTMRYRTVFAAFPLLVVAIVLRKQFQIYDEQDIFITFMESLNLCLRSSLPVFFLALSLFAMSLATTGALVGGRPSRWRTNATESAVDFTKNDLLLGAQDTFFWFLVPLFGLISVGVCVVVNYAALALTYLLSFLYALLTQTTGYIKHEYKRNSLIPYQFAYVVACIVQLATCTRASWHARETRSNTHHNFYNYAHSILVLMLWVLPINVPVLIVWAHNLAVHWLTPFSSHHNVLSIMPFILLVQTLTNGTMIPRNTTRFRHFTSILFFFLAVYAAIYGVSYAYLLHHFVNIVAFWLVLIHFSTSGFSLRNLKNRVMEGEDFGAERATAGGGHTKKMP
ncbi:GPI inositol deacylase [Arachnomyces sp. PD_36]|nr:GPI inositol deacylase [Arachnomyces sp. PD_36]